MNPTKSKKILLLLWRQNKKIVWMIIAVTTLLAALYAYMQTDIYESTGSIDIREHNVNSGRNIVDSLISTHAFSNKNTEKELIQSRAIVKNILGTVEIQHRYYIDGFMKETELYGTSPFTVDMVYGEGLDFYVTYVNHQYYRLEVEGIDSHTKKSWKIKKMYVSGKPVQEEYYMFTLNLKEGKELEKGRTYHFTVKGEVESVVNIQKNLTVDYSSKNSSLLKVHYRDTIPTRSRDINNAIIDEYLTYNIKLKTLESSRILSFIDDQISGIDGKIDESKQKLNGIKKKEDAVALSYSSRELLQKINNQNDELSSISDKLILLNQLRNAIKKGKLQTSLGDSFSSPALERLFERYTTTVYKRKRLLADYTKLHPAVKSATKNIRSIKNTIFSAIKTLRFSLEKRKKKLIKLQSKYNEIIKKMPEKEKIYGDIKRKFIVNEKIYGYFLEKRAMAAIAKASAVNQIRVLDRPIVPSEAILPNRVYIILTGLLLGILLSIVYIILKEYIDDNIKTEEDIREYSSLGLLGSIPYIKESFQTLKVFDSPKSLAAESFRALRTNLQFISKENKQLIVSITSTVGGEGKTTISSNLAGIISLREKKVIILNMDMRKPTLHRKFGLTNTVGMSTLLSLNNTLDEVIQPTKYENIDIIASGPIPPNPSELIENDVFVKTLETLKKTYDIILLDTPPIGLVTDAMYLMKLSDVTLYVLRAKYSKKVFLDKIQRIKTENDIKGLHLVLNGVKNAGDGYGYYEE